MINKIKDARFILIITNIIFAIVTIILPLSNLFKYAISYNGKYVGLYNFRKYIMDKKLVESIFNSIYISSIVSIIGFIVVFLFVYSIQRTNIKLKKIFKWIPIILFSMPTFIHGIGLVCIFGRKGILTNIVPNNIDIYGKMGIIICDVLYVFPVIYSLMYVAFEACDYRLYETADIMETSNLRKFFTITLPNMKFTLINAFFSSFILVFTDIGAPKVIGCNYRLVSIDIYQQVIGQQNFPMAAVAGIILMIPSIIFLVLEECIPNKEYILDKSYRFKIYPNKLKDIIFQLYSCCILFLILFEIVTIAFISFTKNWTYDTKFTLDWYKVKSYGTSIFEIYYNTVVVALITAVVGTILAFIAAYIVERYNKYVFMRKFLYYIYKLPLTIPGLSLGLSYILFFNNFNNPLNFIYDTFIILILSNVIHFFSVPFLNIISDMKKINKNFEGVSEILCVPWYINVVRVILPLSISSIVESFLYYFLNSMITVSAIIFLYTSTTRVIAIELVNKSDMGDLQSCCAIGVMMLVTNIIFKICINKIAFKFNKIV